MTAAAARRFKDETPLYDDDEASEPRKDAAEPAYQPSPWFRFFASDWLAGTRGLKPAEAGILIHLLALMHERGEPLPEDHDRLARRCSTTKAAFVKALDTLLAEGQISRKDGGLWSDMIAGEIAYRAEKSQKLKKNSAKRWEKTKQNQSPSDAKGYREQRLEVEAKPTALPSTNKGSENEASRARTREAIRPEDNHSVKHRYNKGDQFEIEGYDLCEVEQVLKDRVIVRSEKTGDYLRIKLNPTTGRANFASKEEIEHDDEWEDDNEQAS